MTTLRMLLGGLIFAQTIRWAWAWWRQRNAGAGDTVSAWEAGYAWGGISVALKRLLELTGAHPYATLPWDPSARIRVRALTPAERRIALDLERTLAAATDELAAG